MLFAYLLLSQQVVGTLVGDSGVRHLHRCLKSFESGAKTIVDPLCNIDCPVYLVQHYIADLKR